MRTRIMILPSAATVAVLGCIAMVAISRLPAGAQLPIHWNAAGEVDRLASAPFALFLPVWLCAGISALLVIVPRIEPLQKGMKLSTPLLRTVWGGLLAMMVFTELAIAGAAFGMAISPMFWPIVVGVLLILIGNALPKSRPSFLLGIRTPWALIDADNWVATHRLGGWAMIGGGALNLLSAFLPLPTHVRLELIWAALALSIVPPIAYSYLHWRKRTDAA